MKSPQELIEHVVSIVQQKIAKNMRCFYTIKILKNDATTDLIERKAASEEFLNDLQNIISLNKPDTVVVELYKGSSRKVKTPESEFYINLTGREISYPVKVEPLGGFDSSSMYSEMRRNFEQQLQGIREVSGLHATLSIAQLELKHSQERVKELEAELKDAEELIDRLENHTQRQPSLNGPGGVNLIEIGSYLLEGVLRRNPGIIAGTLGVTTDQAKGMFTNNNAPAKSLNQPQDNTTGTVKAEDDDKQISERDQTRITIIENIAGFLRQLSDYHLRCVYELMCAAGKDLTAFETMMQAVGLELPEKPNSETKQ